jgi:hypothetical protein
VWNLVKQFKTKFKFNTPKEEKDRRFFIVRFRWWHPFNIEKFIEVYRNRFDIEERPDYIGWGKIEVFAEIRKEYRIKADTLFAFVTQYKAILFQKDYTPLTKKDEELKDIILKEYPRIRDTPLI